MTPYNCRRSIRLQGYDYTQSGAYFVTICTDQRACLFGEIADGTMILNPVGEVVQACWDAIPTHFPAVELDAFVVMPNHVHGILVITDTPQPGVGAQDLAPLRTESDMGRPKRGVTPNNVAPNSLGSIVRSFKGAVTREVNRRTDGTHGPIWQRNYYEHILRSACDLNRLRAYVESNPAAWPDDDLQPIRSGR